ncbi:hypothetical protein EVAR_76494_1 [Eumeta japonica]|uniref:Uncharacterized protein n=1 Tax=Eumeta variegata TaxID=151549 RepID=A0A4C1T4K8_EUMVA|nr:hypothetical protein EVAR_76494_1 [Eumeta japonica]
MIAGIVLCILMRAAQKRQRRLAFHCPIHGDFYPPSPQSTRKYSQTPVGWWRWLRSWLGMEEANDTPRCPRSAEPAEPAPCPPPLPFLVPSSVVDMASILGEPLSPEQTFGSIKSLAISREVASFPLSRSPTPPPMREPPFNEDSLNEDTITNSAPSREDFECGTATCNYHVVECKLTTTDEINRKATTAGAGDDDSEAVDKRRPVTVSVTIPEGKG